ncbi:MAG: N-acetylmuramoyl-L-alanine amidase [Candidatus Omnitrophica bacterium]|nr:N-acetylmuramoyl-L-alanine amidase [Candidatus Omnitrophota bacterium]
MVNKIKILLVLFMLCICGCATVPVGENIATYSIGGVTYYPLATLCDLRGVTMQYDPLTRIASLAKDQQRSTLRVGDALVLVNDNVLRLNNPVDIWQGAIAVPRQYKEQVFDILFRKDVLAHRRAGIGKIKLNKVVIDPGHGGTDPGAIGKSGLREKDINLDIAKRLSSLLKAEGVQTMLTRSTDKFVPLSTRVSIANRAKADLFISIHSNAARSRALCGFEVFYVAPSVSDSKRAMLTARTTALNLKDADFASNSQELKTIIWDMIYTNSRAESIELSRSLCKIMDSSIDADILGVKNARFQVLKGITMPGALIEVGFVSNLHEERLLKTSAYREKLAVGILEGIRDYSQEMALVEMASK